MGAMSGATGETCEALVVGRSLTRFGAARLAAGALAGTAPFSVGPLRHRPRHDAPALPGPGWVRLQPRLTGICGSDLSALSGRSSRWFDPIVSLPFVPGHEVVADCEDGRRVVLEPVLGCVARSISPVCPECAAGRLGRCANLAQGDLAPGLQSGFCCDTGGGWSTAMVAHPGQLHEVPDELDDAAAVLVEPTACGVHAALRGAVSPSDQVAVIGAGTLGLAVVAALARWSPPASLLVAAKHDHQRSRAAELAGRVPCTLSAPEELVRAARRSTASVLVGAGDTARTGGGVEVTFDCVGSAESLAAALGVTRPGGRVVLVGMPEPARLDLTPLWQREISLTGAYTYGREVLAGTPVPTFELAFELVAAARLGELVSATYPLSRAPEALAHAAEAGRRGATKIAFDCRGATPSRSTT
jgi:threonine dehydrogenase-like Zn-dependent dehydrogenase